jgi:hypothetical protein
VSDPLRGSPNVAGHPGISWSIALQARVEGGIDAVEAERRVMAAWPEDGSAGPAPTVREVAAAEAVDAALIDAANTPYAEGGPLARIVVAPEPPASVVVAGHHAVLDGLGLVAVVGAVIGIDMGTTARGVAAAVDAGALRRMAYPIRRGAEALVRPPTRIEQPNETSVEGDHLVAATTAASVGTAALVATAAAAVRDWNRGAGANATRVVVAVGASARTGSAVRVGRDAAWFRVAVPEGATADDVRQLMASRGPEPPAAPATLRAARATGLAARLERRTGSTLLVSNLGGMVPDDALAEAAFYPSAHGRSGLAVGAVRAGGRTTLTVRARRSGFTEEEARRFLTLVAGRVAASGGGSDGG